MGAVLHPSPWPDANQHSLDPLPPRQAPPATPTRASGGRGRAHARPHGHMEHVRQHVDRPDPPQHGRPGPWGKEKGQLPGLWGFPPPTTTSSPVLILCLKLKGNAALRHKMQEVRPFHKDVDRGLLSPLLLGKEANTSWRSKEVTLAETHHL